MGDLSASAGSVVGAPSAIGQRNLPATFFQKIQKFLCADRPAERLNFIPSGLQKMLAQMK